MPAEIRFWARVDKTGSCWEWRGATNETGYGVFYAGKRYKSHRYAWESEYGSIPDGMNVLHRCDNPPCVRPSHLFLGTKKDNTHDMIKKGRLVVPGLKGEGNANHKLTERDVLEIRASDERGCDLARRFNVTQTLIYLVRSRKAWMHI